MWRLAPFVEALRKRLPQVSWHTHEEPSTDTNDVLLCHALVLNEVGQRVENLFLQPHCLAFRFTHVTYCALDAYKKPPATIVIVVDNCDFRVILLDS